LRSPFRMLDRPFKMALAFFRLFCRSASCSKTLLQFKILKVDFSRALTYPSACSKNKNLRHYQSSWKGKQMQEQLIPIISRILRGTFVPFLLAWGLPAIASAQENCQLPSPPRQAASDGNHGLFFFVYPRAVDGSYSGCQTMWDEKGVQVIVLTFEQGSVIKFE